MGHRFFRLLIVIGIVSYLAAGAALAGERQDKRSSSGNRDQVQVSGLVKGPLVLMKEVVVFQAKMERSVRSGMVRMGVGALTGAVQWLRSLSPKPKPERGRHGRAG